MLLLGIQWLQIRMEEVVVEVPRREINIWGGRR